MKKQMFSLIAVLSLGFVACGDNKNATADGTDAATSTTATTTETTTTTSTGDYAARADEYERNSEAGKYYDARTGKPIRISLDRSSGALTNRETSEALARYIYVDGNDWWAYDDDGTRLGRAKMENEKVLYEGDNNTWVEYDVKWKTDGDESKMKTDGIKVKTEKDGDVKIKTEDGKKIKIDEDGKKVKDDK
jgi:hypothetical protein